MTDKTTFEVPSHLTLGKTVDYESTYNPLLLQAVPRALSRETLSLTDDNLPFSGEDIWTGYELSWLNTKGKPQVAIVECRVPVTSPSLIESKSFKLYLNSFNQSPFSSPDDVEKTLATDLSRCAGSEVKVRIVLPEAFSSLTMAELAGDVIDDLDITVDKYTPDSSLLKVGTNTVEETLVSHLLKSNCLITSQPDWASIQIRYKGPKIERSALLKYLIGFRQHNEFHEQCVERIFCDINRLCSPEKLTVFARYTRRGGLDINPFRSNFEHAGSNVRVARQ
ncbi:NADPH-dependent 7-cyano-7-deazaguanine reductase QueF [Aestuariibacter sp. A3R04]|uniref:NADPH-dependent 7-cyano-7-deazaguanine reductase QueF n=1 Tax=Aestuariibacter sp. A3R04 TaxID=2841571 RepID=UPI001C09B4EB|nr:NADPH-dependent 7-cyano-7-deazaguanine reductase QueF [Aestuariibacter sp. A3R04]MBU3022106.1 NADPH-dependent 7-cyano-7-deazaguanine reductase QueF [Aestuariibacter sp. A3R04]